MKSITNAVNMKQVRFTSSMLFDIHIFKKPSIVEYNTTVETIQFFRTVYMVLIFGQFNFNQTIFLKVSSSRANILKWQNATIVLLFES